MEGERVGLGGSSTGLGRRPCGLEVMMIRI